MLNIKRLSQQDALELIAGAEAKSREMGIPMCIAVTDESGTLITFSRMDGSKVLSVSLSQDKAFSAAVSRRGTHEYNKLCQPGSLTFGIHTSAAGRFTVVGGGLPVLDGEETVGGIGCSSGSAEQDRECAQAGIDHLQSKLRKNDS